MKNKFMRLEGDNGVIYIRKSTIMFIEQAESGIGSEVTSSAKNGSGSTLYFHDDESAKEVYERLLHCEDI